MFKGGLGATDGGIGDESGGGLGTFVPALGRRKSTRQGSAAKIQSGHARYSATKVHEPEAANWPSGLAVPTDHAESPNTLASSASHRAISHRASWIRRYQGALVAVDLLAATIAVTVAFVVRFVIPANAADTRLYLCVGALVPLAWVALIAMNRAYERRFVGVGQAEFERVFRSFLHITALFALGAYATKAEIARGFILLALPLALVLDLMGRYAMRKRLHALRRRGLAGVSVLAVGDAQAVSDFMVLLERDRYAGMNVVGACLVGAHDDTVGLDKTDVPLLRDADSIVDFAHAVDADTVAVVSSGQITPERLRWISWQLEDTEIDLVVSPGLMEVTGPRLHIQPVGGLPLLHVEQPEFDGFRRFLKGTFDRAAAFAALVVLAPVFVAIWLQVRLSSPGPALFRQTRVGRDGREFTMWKFRSMYVDADRRLAELRTHNVNSDGLLFKVPDDPRITRGGKLLRRFSLDELPQLFNVVAGQMSLVGPRPPLPDEVARYGDDVWRRLLVKPGVTGLWQVSGRSNLSWAESVRLDLRYVENWSPALDLMILWKTLRAVISSSGAY